MRTGRVVAGIALLATAVVVAAWLLLAASVMQGAYDHLVGSAIDGGTPAAASGDREGSGSGGPSGPGGTPPVTGAEADGTAAAGADASAQAVEGGADALGTPRIGDEPWTDAVARAEATDPTVSGDRRATLRSDRDGDGDGDGDPERDGAGDANDADPEDGPDAIVDWPVVPEIDALEPITTTAHFTVTVADAGDALLVGAAEEWAPALETLLDEASERTGLELPRPPVIVLFARAYEARCPARGLASPGDDVPFLMVMIDEGTPDVQIRAVLAHEMVHHLTYQDDFVGDTVLTEGVANWGAHAHALAWQGFGSWSEAARSYLDDGTYVSVADETGQIPRDGEDCLARRDRVYNVRAAFVEWLVDTYGRDAVLAMPPREVPDPADPEGKPLAAPDYEAATGLSLVALERRWLAQLTGEASRAPEPDGERGADDDAAAPANREPTEPPAAPAGGARP